MLVIVINGPVNSGKTTTGKALVALLPSAVFIDGDDHGIPSSVPFNDMIAYAIAWLGDQIAAASAPVLILAYPLRDVDFQNLQPDVAKRGARLIVVTLAPPVEVVVANRGTRKLDAWERARAKEMYEEGYANRSFSDLTITDAEGPDVAARQIRQHFALP